MFIIYNGCIVHLTVKVITWVKKQSSYSRILWLSLQISFLCDKTYLDKSFMFIISGSDSASRRRIQEFKLPNQVCVRSYLYTYSVNCTPYTIHRTRTPVTVHRTPYTVHCTPYTVQCTQNTVHGTRTPYTVHRTLYTVHRSMYTEHCTLNMVYRILHAVKVKITIFIFYFEYSLIMHM